MNFFDFDEQVKKESPYINKLTKAKYLSIREKFDEARKLYEEILENDFAEPNAIAGLLRVDSHNFECFFGEEIEKDIKFLKKVIYKLDDEEVEEYLDKYEEYHDILEIKAVRDLEIEKTIRKFEAKKGWVDYGSAYARIYGKSKFPNYNVSIEKELATIKKYADYNYRTSRIYLAMAYFALADYDKYNEIMQIEMNNNPNEAFPAYFLLVFLNQDMFPNVNIYDMYQMIINNNYGESSFGSFVLALMHSNYPGAICDLDPSYFSQKHIDVIKKKCPERTFLEYVRNTDFFRNPNNESAEYILNSFNEKNFLLLYTYLKKQHNLGKL